jgi:hypothetical protein
MPLNGHIILFSGGVVKSFLTSRLGPLRTRQVTSPLEDNAMHESKKSTGKNCCFARGLAVGQCSPPVLRPSLSDPSVGGTRSSQQPAKQR